MILRKSRVRPEMFASDAPFWKGSAIRYGEYVLTGPESLSQADQKNPAQACLAAGITD